MDRESAATTGEERYYTPDEEHISHVFLPRLEGPVDVADMLLFLTVSGGKQAIAIERDKSDGYWASRLPLTQVHNNSNMLLCG